jgi:hypothetical protein
MLSRSLGRWSGDRTAGGGGAEAELDAETVEILRALGYLQ